MTFEQAEELCNAIVSRKDIFNIKWSFIKDDLLYKYITIIVSINNSPTSFHIYFNEYTDGITTSIFRYKTAAYSYITLEEFINLLPYEAKKFFIYNLDWFV